MAGLLLGTDERNAGEVKDSIVKPVFETDKFSNSALQKTWKASFYPKLLHVLPGNERWLCPALP